MGLDLITLYRSNLRNGIHPVDNCSFEEAIFYNGFTGFYFKEHPQNPHLSHYYFKVEGINVEYLPFYNGGELRIKFNIPKLAAGTNIASIYAYNIQQLFQTLSFKLWPYIELSRATHLRYWSVSMVEINADIILETQKVHAVYNVLKKTSSTYKYKFCEEMDDGNGGKTLYFIPHNAKFHSSDIVVKFYYKIPEMKAHDIMFNLNNIYNSNGIINLGTGQSILRMEIELRRDKINQYFKNKNSIVVSGLVKKVASEIGYFEQIVDLDFQLKILNDCINEFKLNRAITTPKRLRDIIRSESGLSAMDKKTYWNTIQHENTHSHKKKPSYNTKRDCINLIKSYGYHFLYADVEVDPIIIEDILASLPHQQQREISRYKESNIYRDMLYYKSTPQRVYRDRIY